MRKYGLSVPLLACTALAVLLTGCGTDRVSPGNTPGGSDPAAAVNGLQSSGGMPTPTCDLPEYKWEPSDYEQNPSAPGYNLEDAFLFDLVDNVYGGGYWCGETSPEALASVGRQLVVMHPNLCDNYDGGASQGLRRNILDVGNSDLAVQARQPARQTLLELTEGGPTRSVEEMGNAPDSAVARDTIVGEFVDYASLWFCPAE